jgi:signal transduction histidine kinase
VIKYGCRPEQKSLELEAIFAELRGASRYLRELDHELRTLLTSIRAFSKILLTNLDVEAGQCSKFLVIGHFALRILIEGH